MQGISPSSCVSTGCRSGPKKCWSSISRPGRKKARITKKQMGKYLAAAAPLFPGKKCCGWLLYIDRDEIEEVPCSN